MDLYVQAEAKSEFDLNFGKTKRDQNNNIIYNQGLKTNLYAVIGAGLENSITINNKNDSITTTIEIYNTLYGDGFLFEFYRSAILNTNSWILKYYFNLSLGIGTLIEPFTLVGIGQVINKILQFDILTAIEGEVDLKEKAKESKNKLYKYAKNILYNEFNEFNKISIPKGKIKNKNIQTEKLLKQKALIKAWEIKHYQIKQNLISYAKNKITNIIPSFLNTLTEIINNSIDKKIKNKLIKKSAFFIISNIKNVINNLSSVFLLAIFSKPVEKVISEITLKDLKKV